MTESTVHEIKFDKLMDHYTCGMIGIASWATGDLVHLSLLIDAELQQRADEGEDPEEMEQETLPWEDDES